MPYEIERKFLVTNNSWQSLATDFDFLEQGYLFVNAQKTLRVRIINHKKAFLGFKAAIDAGLICLGSMEATIIKIRNTFIEINPF
ncbi:MAG: hypothetical protein IPI59_09330 [Sphingobacteriales bacterium]|nr:hypothetical protein [Sphingobacteriales bacterium]